MTGLHRDQVISPSGRAPSRRHSLVREYFGFEPRKFVYVLLIIVGVMAVVTVPYVMIVGFDKWSSDMREASHLMWAGYTPAATRTPPCAVGGSRYPVTPVAWAAPRSTAASQYVCPRCGTAGLPNWTASGQPTCPSCGSIMQVAPQQSNIDLAAAP